MSVIGNSLATFGFHSHSTVKKYETTLTDPKTLATRSINILEGSSQHNFLAMFGYIPVIGSIVGFLRVAAAVGYLWQCHKNLIADPKRSVACGMIAKGVVEMGSCGLLWLPLDLIVTTGRIINQCCCSGKAPSQLQAVT